MTYQKSLSSCLLRHCRIYCFKLDRQQVHGRRILVNGMSLIFEHFLPLVQLSAANYLIKGTRG